MGAVQCEKGSVFGQAGNEFQRPHIQVYVHLDVDLVAGRGEFCNHEKVKCLFGDRLVFFGIEVNLLKTIDQLFDVSCDLKVLRVIECHRMVLERSLDNRHKSYGVDRTKSTYS